MGSVVSVRRMLLAAVAVFALFLVPTTASAQTGMLQGKVTDAANNPMEGVKIIFAFQDGINRTNETKTNKKGEFVQIGLPPGNYKVTAEKDGMSQTFDARVRLSAPAEVVFQLRPGQIAPGTGPSKEEAAKNNALKAVLDAGLAANNSGDYDTAIAKFNEALVTRPACHSCYYSIGFAYNKKKEFDKAEAAFKKAVELKPDYVDAYNELATVYNTQKKFAEAGAASAEAAKYAGTAGAGAGSPDILYNQGVILWNSGKIPEARKNFEEVIKLSPNHADAHYQLGMANLNEGKLPDAVASFENYLKLAPTGQYAVQAKAMVDQLKQ